MIDKVSFATALLPVFYWSLKLSVVATPIDSVHKRRHPVVSGKR